MPLHSNRISEEKLLKVIRTINPNEAHGWDGISARKIKIYDSSVILLLRIIFKSCLIKCSFLRLGEEPMPFQHKKNSEIRKKYGKIFEKRIDGIYLHLAKIYLLFFINVCDIHDPTVLALLTQLRVGLSALNFQKCRHNCNGALNPLCPINDGLEGTEHFLLHCQSCHVETPIPAPYEQSYLYIVFGSSP